MAVKRGLASEKGTVQMKKSCPEGIIWGRF
jgi:hypothetical protein